MIRGRTALALLLALLLAAVPTQQSENIEITKVQRVVTLSGAYPTENIRISFVANQDSVSHFTYLCPLEYDEKLSKISFTKGEKDRSPYSYSRSILAHEGQTYAKYRVQFPFNHQVGDTGDIYVHTTFLYRFDNLPASIGLTEDQKLQFEDTKFIVSPYNTAHQETRILQHGPDGSKKGSGDVQFSKSSIQPFTHIKHTVFGVNNNPQVQFSEVEKVIELSHWGNIGITENYKIVNKGPSLKGEFSRVTFGSKGYEIKNAFKGIDFDLPYETWGLYYRDEVGNISTSKAYRDDSSDIVRVSLMPRFSLLGGWKSNWQVGYNLNTKGYLFHSGSNFELRNLRLEYALERVLTEKFTVKIVLPDGAQNVKVTIGGKQYDDSALQTARCEGYFDFNGRPTYIIPNYQGSFKEKDIDVSYSFPQSRVYQKPVVLSLFILVVLGFAILMKRFKLEAFAEEKQE